MKQKKSRRGSGMNILFLLFYSPNPRNHVRILIYRNWSNLNNIIQIIIVLISKCSIVIGSPRAT